MMIPTLDLLVSESRIAKVLSFAKQYLKPVLRGGLVSQKCLAKVDHFARIFATEPWEHEDWLRTRFNS
jgi:hypothetical protein